MLVGTDAGGQPAAAGGGGTCMHLPLAFDASMERAASPAPLCSLGGVSPEKKASIQLRTLFTFLAVRIICAQVGAACAVRVQCCIRCSTSCCPSNRVVPASSSDSHACCCRMLHPSPPRPRLKPCPPARPPWRGAQMSGSGRGNLGAYNSEGYARLRRLLEEVPFRDGDAWLETLMQEDPALGAPRGRAGRPALIAAAAVAPARPPAGGGGGRQPTLLHSLIRWARCARCAHPQRCVWRRCGTLTHPRTLSGTS